MPGERRVDRQAGAVERHVHEVEAERLAEMLADKMWRRPGPGGSETVFGGTRSDQRDEFADGLYRQRGVNAEHRGRRGGNHDRIEVPIGIVGYRVVQGRIDD